MAERETVVVIGGGGAESALVDAYGQSEHVDHIIAIPGNDMMQELTEKPVTTIDLRPDQTIQIAFTLAEINDQSPIAFVDIRSERAIAGSLTEHLRIVGIPSVSPSGEAGKLEWDKYVARERGTYLNLPQPGYDALQFQDYGYGNDIPPYYEQVLERNDGKRVVKASGLADGKGVEFAEGREEIERAIERLRQEFPKAAERVLLEEMLVGEEFSAFALSNGKSFHMLGYAQDHKRVFDGDSGPNTGGMGAVSRPQLIEDDPRLARWVRDVIFEPVFQDHKDTGVPYRGVLFLGGMAVEKLGGNVPYVIEFNARWGDPEAQVLVPGLEVDLFEMNSRVLRGNFKNYEITSDEKVRVAVAGASKGYPGDYSDVRGKEIHGFDAAREVSGVKLYGAGVAVEDGHYYANGGRLFYVVGEGEDVIEARDQAYEAMSHIRIDGGNLHFRTDIGWRDVERLEAE